MAPWGVNAELTGKGFVLNTSLKSGSEFYGFQAEQADIFPKHRLTCRCLKNLLPEETPSGNQSGGTLFACDSVWDSGELTNGFESQIGPTDVRVGWAHSKLLAEQLSNCKRVVVTRCFLEMIADPRPLLRAFKIASLEKLGNLVIVGSVGYEGLRSWSDTSLMGFLEALDFTCKKTSNRKRTEHFVQFDSQAIPAFNGLHPSTTEFLLVATEDARVEPTGGIGTYTAAVVDRISETAILYVAPNQVETAKRTVSTFDLVGNLDPDQLFDGAGLVEALKVLLTKFPLVKGLEAPDYRSLGYRLTQARETGGLPLDLAIRVFLHGNIDYLKFQESNGAWKYTEAELRLQVKDAKAFRDADEVVSPTKFLADLMSEEFGYELSNPRLQRLPFDYKSLPEITSGFRKPSQIIFIGKFSKAKGWKQLIDALGCEDFSAIEKVRAFAPGHPEPAELNYLNKNWDFEHQHLNHSELLRRVIESKHDAIFVLPYLGDNHPFAVLEQVLMGTRFVTFNAGGSSELIPEVIGRESFLSDPNPGALATAIQAWMSMNLADVEGVTSTIATQAHVDQDQINEDFVNHYSKVPIKAIKAPDLSRRTVGVVTPFFNTDIELVDRLFESIANQTVRPDSWIIVDDGSSEANSVLLENWIAGRMAPFPISILRQENQGLASARNVGLESSIADYVLFVDSDDVLAATALQSASLALNLCATAIAVSGFGLYFEKSRELNNSTAQAKLGRYHKPLGTELARAIGFTQNEFITSCAMFRRKEFAEQGAWGEPSKATWEDWSLYLRLTWSGEKLCYIPQVFFGYRYVETSMSRTFNTYFGQRRLVKNLPGFTKMEANALANLQAPFDNNLGASDDLQVLQALLQHSRLAWLIRIFSTIRASIPPRLRGYLNRLFSS